MLSSFRPFFDSLCFVLALIFSPVCSFLYPNCRVTYPFSGFPFRFLASSVTKWPSRKPPPIPSYIIPLLLLKVFCRRAFQIPQPVDREQNYTLSLWPDPKYEPAFRRLVEENEKLIKPLTQSLFRFLNVSDPHCYDRKLTNTNIGKVCTYTCLIKG